MGKLAKATGITVRTLHHYDEIGLLKPAARSAAGYRLYSRVEVHRLQQITSLRQLGLSLDDVAACLAEPGLSPVAVLDRHIALLTEQMEGQRRLMARLEGIRKQLVRSVDVSTDEFLATIKETIMHEKYYTPEQLEQLRLRREEVGEERIEEVQQEWADLFEEFRKAMEAGTDPEAESVQALARKSRALVREFTGGDLGIEASLANMYRAEGVEPINRHHGFDVDPELWAYMGRAQGVGRGAGEEG